MVTHHSRSNVRLELRIIAAALIPIYLLTLCPATVYAAAVDANGGTGRQTIPNAAIETTRPRPREKVDVNTTVPQAISQAAQTFSAAPTAAEFARLRVMPEPLLPMNGEVSLEENQDLAQTLKGSDAAKPGKPTAAALERFLERHPQTAWRTSILVNLGLMYRSEGYWSRARKTLAEAWSSGRGEKETTRQLLVDRALGELTELLARLGHSNELEGLLAEVGDRDVRGPGTEKVAQARASLHLMETEPEKSFRCGPFAIGRIWAVQNPGASLPNEIHESTCTPKGTSLTMVQEFGQKLGVRLQIAKREAGAPLLFPAVIHWKEGHYAALIKRVGDAVVVQDPTFGLDSFIPGAAVDAESSGFFLVPEGSLPKGWSAVTASESAAVWGKGAVPPSGNPPPPCVAPTLDPCKKKTCSSPGMATYDVDPSRINLLLHDTPLSYVPPRGPAVDFTIHYSAREVPESAVAEHTHLGPKWNVNFLSYLVDNVARPLATTGSGSGPIYGTQATVYGPGGGSLRFVMPDTANAVSSGHRLTRSTLSRQGDSGYELQNPDGSKRVYGLPNSEKTRFKLIESYDPHGNKTTYHYSSGSRLSGIGDSLGQISTFGYSSNDPANSNFYRLQQITDPFGRFCSFEYNALGQLWKITDSAGLVSEFTYGAGDFITKLTTPYGDTHFVKNDIGANRRLDITDPTGETERVEFRYADAAAVPDAGASVPAGMLTMTSYWEYRNTYYWDKKAFAEDPNNTRIARLMHWLHTPDVSAMADVLESEKKPLESRVFYNYPGQSQSHIEGTSSNPTKIGRVLDDGTSQVSDYSYNAQGQVTKSATPGNAATPARTTTFAYAPNGRDVTAVYQQRVGGQSTDPFGQPADKLGSTTYTAAGLPQTVTDTAGQTTTFSYNSFGQVLSETNAKNEQTTFTYDRDEDADGFTDGYLLSVTGSQPGTTTTLEYDGYGRLWKSADAQAYTVTFEYDAIDGVATKTLNRPARVIYPDGTYEQIHYDRLDAKWLRDRQGRWTQNFHDSNRRLAGVQDPEGRLTQYFWCGCGSLEAIIDPANNQTSWIRDEQGRIVDKVYPDNSVVHHEYEQKSGRLKSITDARSQVTSFAYYIDNSLASVVYTTAVIATPGVSFTYEPAYGRLATMTDGVGQTIYGYKPVTNPAQPGAGRLETIDGPWANDTMVYSYDQLGRVVGRTINGAVNQVGLAYDSIGRIESMSTPIGGFAPAYVGTSDQLDYLDYPNGQRIDYDYYPNVPAVPGTGNGDRRLKEIRNLGAGAAGNGAVLSQFNYEYGVAGQITKWKQAHSAMAAAREVGLSYDRADQLLSATVRNANSGTVTENHGYLYDAAGNRDLAQKDQAPVKAVYNELNQLVTRQGGGDFLVRGELNEPGAVTLEKLSGPGGSIEASRRADVNSGGTAFWGKVPVTPGANTLRLRAKDASGNETLKEIEVNVTAGVGHEYIYDSNGNLTEVKENGGIIRSYEWDAVNRLVAINATATQERSELSYDIPTSRLFCW
jgi:YD repeat-containing protein